MCFCPEAKHLRERKKAETNNIVATKGAGTRVITFRRRAIRST
jgi:hypothetical protein